MRETTNDVLGCAAGCGVALLIAAVVILALLNVVVAGAEPPTSTPTPVPVTCHEGTWFDSEPTGRIWLVSFEETLGCRWGTPDDQDALQRAGKCGWEAASNRFAVLTHNWKCDRWTCPIGEGWVSNIPLLEPGDRVELCEFGNYWRGRVVETILSHGEVQPQDDFTCRGEACGTIVTSTGERQGEWGPTGQFVVVRISYTRVTR